MNKEEARRIIELLNAAQENLDSAVSELESFDYSEEKASLRRTFAEVIGTLAADAILPIVAIYPDLNPYPTDS